MNAMLTTTDDLRIHGLRPLLPPAILMEELPLDEKGAAFITESRKSISNILFGDDKRLLVIVGPCSIHDPAAALDYAGRLREQATKFEKELFIAMRVYFEKPRTTVGWKGLINDPHLDGSFAINEGLRKARKFLLDLTALGLPAASEFLDPITPQFIADLISWGAIGARTTESQVHRELASGLSMPVGFKNGTNGTVQIAIDAIRSAASPHRFLSVTKQGVAAIVRTMGNPDCHVILRGGKTGPNFSADRIAEVVQQLRAVKLPESVVIDLSHANSGKDPEQQPSVARDLATQIRAKNKAIRGVMMESFIEGGRQDHDNGNPLKYGQSITDGCLGWDKTVPVLAELASAIADAR